MVFVRGILKLVGRFSIDSEAVRGGIYIPYTVNHPQKAPVFVGQYVKGRVTGCEGCVHHRLSPGSKSLVQQSTIEFRQTTQHQNIQKANANTHHPNHIQTNKYKRKCVCFTATTKYSKLCYRWGFQSSDTIS